MICRMTTAALVAALIAPFGTGREPPEALFDDGEFMKAVAVGGLYDTRLSDLVGSQTKNADVRKLAASIVADHVVAAPALKAVAKEAGVELPRKLDDEHQKQYESFKAYKGDDIDRDYVRSVVRRYTLAVAAFERASKAAKNPAIRTFAAQKLPSLQKHLKSAKNLDK